MKKRNDAFDLLSLSPLFQKNKKTKQNTQQKKTNGIQKTFTTKEPFLMQA